MMTKTEVVFEPAGACPACGVEQCLPASFLKNRRADHQVFYCPNGHKQMFPGETEAQRLAKKLAETEKRLKEREQADAQAVADAQSKLAQLKAEVG